MATHQARQAKVHSVERSMFNKFLNSLRTERSISSQTRSPPPVARARAQKTHLLEFTIVPRQRNMPGIQSDSTEEVVRANEDANAAKEVADGVTRCACEAGRNQSPLILRTMRKQTQKEKKKRHSPEMNLVNQTYVTQMILATMIAQR